VQTPVDAGDRHPPLPLRIVAGGLDDARVVALLRTHVERARAETARGQRARAGSLGAARARRHVLVGLDLATRPTPTPRPPCSASARCGGSAPRTAR
jgi:hypothetical protein